MNALRSYWMAGLAALALVAGSPGAAAATVRYSYDPAGRLSGVNDGVSATRYTYDAAGNLLNVAVGQAAAVPANYGGIWWNSPAGSESGWGINFAHQGDTIFATWFTYDAAGKPWWLIALLARTAGSTFSGPVSSVQGQPFNAQPWDLAKIVETEIGSMTVGFTDGGNGSMSYIVNGIAQTKPITRQVFGAPVPTCTYGAQSSLALAVNYQDLWWASPAGSEAGWGINLTQQGSVIFATWFTYDAAGKPWWLIAVLTRTVGNTFAGPVSVVSGQPFNAQPWDLAKIVETEVGAMQIAFSDGNSARLDYTVNGIAQSKPITRQVFAPPGTVCN